jgi:predicted DNA-binding transcriptional regulator AlpA
MTIMASLVNSGANMPDHEIYLTGRLMRARYNVSGMTLYRWERDEALEFPRPVNIKGRKYWPLSVIEAWERSPSGLARSRRRAE